MRITGCLHDIALCVHVHCMALVLKIVIAPPCSKNSNERPSYKTRKRWKFTLSNSYRSAFRRKRLLPSTPGMAECLPRVHAEEERSTPPPPPAPPTLAKPKPSRPSSSKSRSQREKDEEIEESLQRLKNQGKYVKLNVGGSLHYTTLGTLTKHDNMLRAMFSERIPLQTDDEGEGCVCVFLFVLYMHECDSTVRLHHSMF